METEQLSDCAKDLLRAANLLQQGQIVGIPTETVYGLAADAQNENAVRKIFEAKGRPADNPLIVHIAYISQLHEVAASVPDVALRLAEKFWPGPMTMILPKSSSVPMVTSGGLETVGIRMPSHPVAQALIRLSDRWLAAPSANRSGYPSPTTASHVYRDMHGKIAAIVDGGPCTIGVESTVLQIEAEDTVRILRPGAVTKGQLQTIVPNVEIDQAVLQPLDANGSAPSPGMKYQHYAPKAHVTLIQGSLDAFSAYVSTHISEGTYALVFQDNEGQNLKIPYLTYGSSGQEQAQLLFSKLRELDDLGAERVFVRAPNPEGIGLAVYNRLIRAAGFEVIQV